VAGGEVLVVDDGTDPQSFQRFFSSSPDIAEMMGEAGVTSEPQPVSGAGSTRLTSSDPEAGGGPRG
jgi:hypothetical protein